MGKGKHGEASQANQKPKFGLGQSPETYIRLKSDQLTTIIF